MSCPEYLAQKRKNWNEINQALRHTFPMLRVSIVDQTQTLCDLKSVTQNVTCFFQW